MILMNKKLKEQMNEEDKAMIKSPRADKKKEEQSIGKHRRKGVPLKSLRGFNPILDGFFAVEGDGKAKEGAEEGDKEEEGMVTRGCGRAEGAGGGGHGRAPAKGPGGAQRRRKPAAPARSL